MKIKIEIDESAEETELTIRCKKLDKNVEKIKKAAENIDKEPDIAFYKDNVQYFPPLDSVLFFETSDPALCAHTADDVFQVKAKLYELENLLPRKFVRVSKSAIVNVRSVYSVEKNIASASVISFAETHKQVFASRNYYKLLKQRLGERRFL